MRSFCFALIAAGLLATLSCKWVQDLTENKEPESQAAREIRDIENLFTPALPEGVQDITDWPGYTGSVPEAVNNPAERVLQGGNQVGFLVDAGVCENTSEPCSYLFSFVTGRNAEDPYQATVWIVRWLFSADDARMEGLARSVKIGPDLFIFEFWRHGGDGWIAVQGDTQAYDIEYELTNALRQHILDLIHQQTHGHQAVQ